MLHWFHQESSGASRPTDKGGPGYPDSEIRGWGAVFFSALPASVWSKNEGEAGASPGSVAGESNGSERES